MLDKNPTIVINLFAGSGAGKSTTAALLFGQMKLAGLEVELVREYVKSWAWAGRKTEDMDQLYLLGKQSNYEKLLYQKVDFIVTDSPVLLCGIYEEYHSKGRLNYAGIAAHAFMRHAEEKGVTHKNYLLNRKKPFNPKGRYETEEQAKAVDVFVKEYLTRYEVPFTEVNCADEERASFIMHDLGLSQAKGV